MTNKVLNVISDFVGDNVTPQMKVKGDTYLDSPDCTELATILEAEFKIKPSWSEWDDLFSNPETTMNDVANFVERKISEL